MKEMRRDQITGDLIIYSSYRNKRPHDTVKINKKEEDEGKINSDKCPFCRGNEHLNDIPTYLIEEDGEWIAKSVKNKFPIIDLETEHIFGEHEVVVETYRHNGSYYNMSLQEFSNVFDMYIDRYKGLSSRSGIEYINIFKNSLRDAGASLMHPHSQIVSFNLIPAEIIKELKVARSYMEHHHENLYDHIVESEISHAKRLVYNGEKFLVFIPQATRYNGEIRIICKEEKKIDQWSQDEIGEISYIYKKLFKKWEEYNDGEIAFNVIIHTYPLSGDYDDVFRTHFHIIPRKFNFGGFELSTNLFVCGTDPEELAASLKFY